MKTKNKMIASLEIVIVLCSVFLVAISAIAAEQTAQEVSISTITTASEDDYVLGVYGNANEDDTIDMRDLTYVKLIFFGKKPETELADAKYDGKINPLDFIQIKLIIVGKEKEITLVDEVDRIVTVKKPVERVYLVYMNQAEVLRVLGVLDKVVGVNTYLTKGRFEIYFPEFSKLPGVGAKDYEAILSLNPDLVITYGALFGGTAAAEAAEKLPGIPVVGFAIFSPPFFREGTEKLGYIFDKKDEGKHYFDDFHDKYINLIKSRTEGLSEEKRPNVYEEAYAKPYRIYRLGIIEAAGGRDIFDDLPIGGGVIIDPEAVIERNPDIIIKKLKYTDSGYAVEDISKAIAVWDEIRNRPELVNVAAVKNGKVYTICGDFTYGLHYPIAVAYYAKMFYPELFDDLDTQAIHQEFLERQGLDFNVYGHGVWLYPPLEE